jgi:hypothetical protein
VLRKNAAGWKAPLRVRKIAMTDLIVGDSFFLFYGVKFIEINGNYIFI